MSDRKRKGAARAGKLPRAGGKHVAVVVGVVLCVKRVAKRGGVVELMSCVSKRKEFVLPQV